MREAGGSNLISKSSFINKYAPFPCIINELNHRISGADRIYRESLERSIECRLWICISWLGPAHAHCNWVLLQGMEWSEERSKQKILSVANGECPCLVKFLWFLSQLFTSFYKINFIFQLVFSIIISKWKKWNRSTKVKFLSNDTQNNFHVHIMESREGEKLAHWTMYNLVVKLSLEVEVM